MRPDAIAASSLAASLRRWRQILVATLLTAGVALSAPTLSTPPSNPAARSRVHHVALRTVADTQSGGAANLKKSIPDAQRLEESREAGLLTDWHLEGHFGHGGEEEFARAFPPEKQAAKAAARHNARYELIFPEGKFALPPAMASLKGVFYATSTTYLSGSGQWNVYLESGAEAEVFVDGRRVLESVPQSQGVRRGTIHADSGYHSVMVKFTAQAAPFQVAILPPNSGSRRKNNTPFLKAAPTSENLLAKQMGEVSASSQS